MMLRDFDIVTKAGPKREIHVLVVGDNGTGKQAIINHMSGVTIPSFQTKTIWGKPRLMPFSPPEKPCLSYSIPITQDNKIFPFTITWEKDNFSQFPERICAPFRDRLNVDVLFFLANTTSAASSIRSHHYLNHWVEKNAVRTDALCFYFETEKTSNFPSDDLFGQFYEKHIRYNVPEINKSEIDGILASYAHTILDSCPFKDITQDNQACEASQHIVKHGL